MLLPSRYAQRLLHLPGSRLIFSPPDSEELLCTAVCSPCAACSPLLSLQCDTAARTVQQSVEASKAAANKHKIFLRALRLRTSTHNRLDTQHSRRGTRAVRGTALGLGDLLYRLFSAAHPRLSLGCAPVRMHPAIATPAAPPHGHGHLSIAARRRGITVAITPCAVAHLPLLQCTPPSPSPARLYLSRYPLPAPREPVHVLFPSSTRWAADSSWAVSSGAAHLDAHGDGGDERHAVLDGAVRGDERDRVRGVG